MSFFSNSNPTSGVGFGAQTGLSAERTQSILRWVYIWMGFGLLITTIVSAVTATNETLLALFYENPAILIGAIIVELIVVFVLSLALPRLSPGLAAVLFMVYAALNGFTLAWIFLAYELGTVALAFGTTAATFGAMSVIGFTTKIDLQKYSTFFLMALIGLIIASVVNLFLRSSGLDFVISIAGVLIFTALTAYDTQRIKQMAIAAQNNTDDATAQKLSIIGALKLYLDFINLFLFLLRLFGRRR